MEKRISRKTGPTVTDVMVVPQQLPEPPAEVIVEVETPVADQNTVLLSDIIEQVSATFIGGTPAALPELPTNPMVFCDLCGRSVALDTTFTLPSASGNKHYCKKDPLCKKAKGKVVSVKEQAKVASAKVTAAKMPKAKAEKKGPNPNIGRFDNCLLSAKENKRANSESIRSAVYYHRAANSGCTIKDMEKDGVALLPVLRDCVKKLFADLKIGISGWEVVTPRTLNFREVK